MGISRTVAKNTIFNFIGTTASAAISFVVSILLARGLGVEEYGLYTFLMWFLSLGSLLVNLGLGETTRRYIAEATGQGNLLTTRGITQLTLALRCAATILLSILIVGFAGLLTNVFTEVNSGVYFMLITLVLIPDSLDHVIRSVYGGFQRYEYGAYIVLGTSPIRLVGIIVMLALGYGVGEIIIMTAAVSLIALLSNIFFLRRLMPLRSLVSKSQLDPGVRKSALKYSLTLTGVQGVNYFTWSQAEVLFLGLYCSISDIAFYNLAFKIPRMIISMVPFVFGSVLLPTVAEQYGRGDIDKVKAIYITSARYLMMLTFPIVVGGIVLAAPIIHVIYGWEYQPAVVLMQIVFIPFSTMGLTHASTSIIFGINKPSFILKSGIIVIIVSIGLYLWAIPTYGVMGAAIASSVPRIAVFFIYNFYVYKKLDVHWPVGDSIRVIMASLIMGAAVYGVQYSISDVLSLAIGIPCGVLLYILVLIGLRFITQQEITILRKFEKQVPSVIRSQYMSIVGLIENYARKSQ